jgi:hypothetical protein
MSPVKDADPAALGLDEAFNAAMGAPARPKEPAAPEDVDPEAPFGREEDGTPKAPFGMTKEGKPRRSAAGRRPKEDTPRTAAAAAAPAGTGAPSGAEPKAAHDYSAALSEFGDAVWFGASALGKGGSAIPIVGKFIPERKVAAQAAVFQSYKPNLVKAVNLAAQHNAKAARWAASIETGEITWVMMVGFMVMPFVTMSAAIWKGDEALARIDENLTVERLAEQNDVKLDKYLKDIGEQLDALAAAAQLQALADMSAELDNDEETAAALAVAREAGIL